jgi:hypothetical protein
MKNASQVQRHNRTHHEGRIYKKARSSVTLEEEEAPISEFHMDPELPDHQAPDTQSTVIIRFIDVGDMQGFGILLPRILAEGESATFAKDGLYALVTSEWEEMLPDGSIGTQPVVSLEDIH